MKDQKSSASEENFNKESLSVGKILVSARKEQGLTTDIVAARLCLTESYIKALETENFEQLPGDTFVRGYLRNYADLVCLNGEELVRVYLEQKGLAEQSATSRKRDAVSASGLMSQKTLIIVLVVVALVSLGVILTQKEDSQTATASLNDFSTDQISSTDSTSSEELDVVGESTTGNDLQESAVSGEVDLLETQVSESASISVDDSVSSEVDSTDEIESAESITVDTVNQVDQVAVLSTQVDPAQVDVSSEGSASQEVSWESLPKTSLEFTFNGDCWYEVVDATGKILAQRTKAAGQTSEVEGVAPFKVTMGDTRVVEMKVAGEAYDLSRFHKKKAARFTVGI